MEWVELGPCRALWSGGEEQRIAALVPGAKGGAFQPAFVYLSALLEGDGWSVLALHDEYRDGNPAEWAAERVRAALAFRPAALLVGKSMASLAAGLVELPAVWLTPLLREPGVAEAIRPPALLVGGTADPLWDSAAAHRLGVEVLELENVHHALGIAADAYASLEAMRRVLDAVGEFARRI